MDRVLVRLTFVAALVCARTVLAAEPLGRFEPWIAVTGSLTPPSGSLTTAFSPLLQGGGISQPGRGGQTLTLDATRGPGFEGGLAFFPSQHLGLHALGSYSSSDLGGLNTPYEVHLVYSSRPPPSNELREFSYDRSVDWPETVGALKRLTLAVGPVARYRGRRLSGSVSAGLAYHRLHGQGESLGFTAFRLGGHSTLIETESHLAFALQGASAMGWHLGAQADLALSRRAAVLLGLRYLGGGDIEVPVRLSRIVNEEGLIFAEPLADIQAALRPSPARISPGAFQVVLGLALSRSLPRLQARP